jgi:hypothetical protein
MLHVGKLSYGLSRTFFDSQRLIARMAEMNVEQTVLSPATPFVNFDVSASLERESAELYNDEIGALRKATPDGRDTPFPLGEPDPSALCGAVFRARHRNSRRKVCTIMRPRS